MTRAILFVAALSAGCHPSPRASVAPSAAGPRAADSVRLITSDIPNFWRAYALAAGKGSAERVRIFQTVYLQPGSAGLRDWMRLRLMNRDTVRARLIALGWTAGSLDSLYKLPRGTPGRDSLERATEPVGERSAAEELVRALATFPRYYAAVRATTLSLDSAATVTGAIRRGLSRLAELYPEARFPDVYFVIGTLSTGGTVGRTGMLIGTEQYASGPDTPRDELPEWARVATAANSFANIAGLVVHEAVHAQQRPAQGPNTLLRHALGEGIADFLSELAVGPWHAESERHRYGHAHERAVWLDFKDEMATDSTIRTWMYNGMVPAPKNHGATDIGYWVGYRIARVYYEGARGKAAAIRELILLPDPERLLAESGYAAYAEALPR
jgi:hypothetical protein